MSHFYSEFQIPKLQCPSAFLRCVPHFAKSSISHFYCEFQIYSLLQRLSGCRFHSGIQTLTTFIQSPIVFLILQVYTSISLLRLLCRVIPEEGAATSNGSGVKRLVFCTGKVYYDLTAARKEAGLEDSVAIARVEQVRGPE